MPILGLTNRPASFPELGQLRKGAPKPKEGNKPGAELKHFRFTSDDQDALSAFADIYGSEPRSIRVYVPFKTVDENFDAWQEEWAASSLKHRCDGVTCVLWLDGAKYKTDPKPCPGGCKASGRLKVIIPELRRLAYVTVLTTSKNDVMNIHAQLLALQETRGDLRGIPMLLKRVPDMISTPRDDKRVRVEKWMISIEAQPSWVELQLSAQEQAALPAGAPLALPPYDGEDDEEAEAPMQQTAEDIEIITAMGMLYLKNGKTEAEFEAYMVKHIAPLTTPEKRTMLESWQKKALANEAKAAAEKAKTETFTA